MKRFSLCLVFVFALCCAGTLSGTEKASVPSSDEAVKTEKKNSSLEKSIRTLNEIFGTFEKELPGFSETLTDEDFIRAENAYFSTLRPGLSVSGKRTENFRAPDGKKSGGSVFYAPKPLENGKLLLLRLDALTEESASALRKSLLSRKEKPFGVVLDLRNCSDGTEKGVSEIQKILSNLPTHKLPIAILISGGTSGAGEVLAHLLCAAHSGLTVGEKTAGHPYPVKKISFSKRRWIVPAPPAGWKSIPYKSVEPSIQSRTGTHPVDEALRRGAELLICLDSVLPPPETKKK